MARGIGAATRRPYDGRVRTSGGRWLIARYTLTSYTTASFDWTDSEGVVHHADLEPNTVVEFDDPCSALAFIQAGQEATGAGTRAVTENATEAALQQACIGHMVSTILDETFGTPHPAPEDPPAVPADGTGDGEVTEDDATDPTVTGAPNPDVAFELKGHPRATGESDGRTLEEQHTDREDPMSREEILQQLYDQFAEEEIESELERVLRNEPTVGLPHFAFARNDAQRFIIIADPVDLFGGSYGLRIVDVQLPSSSFPLEFVRTYRSGMPYFGPWGFNWDHSYNQCARPLEEGHVAIWTGQLHEEIYRLQADGSFDPQIGVFRMLEHEPATVGAAESYRLRDRGGRVRIFERPAGWSRPDRLPLVAIEDAYGNRHDLAYDADGHLVRVSDEHGREITLHYGGCGLLEQLRDHTGREWRYIHDPDNQHLIAVIEPATAASPDGTGHTYEYDILEDHPRLRHNLIRLTDAEGRTVVLNEYGKDPASDDFSRVVTQYFGCSRADFRATRLQDVPRIESAINVPALRVETLIDGTYRVNTFNARGNLLDERYRLTRDASYRLFVRILQYDEQGNQTIRIEPNGLTLHNTYDHENADPRARGNLMQVFREAPPTAPLVGRRLLEMTYEPEYQQVRSVRDESGNTTELAYDYEENPGGASGLVRVTYPETTLPDGTRHRCEETCTYDAAGRLLLQTTAQGRQFAYSYDASGLVESVTIDPGGLALRESYAYDAWGNGAALTDPLGRSTRFAYDAVGRLLRVQFPSFDETGPANHYDYTPSGHLASVRIPRGEYDEEVIADSEIRHDYTHDALGRIVAMVEGANTAAPRTHTFRYDGFDQLTHEIDALGRIRERVYDERGLIIEETFGDAAGRREWRFIFDRNGNQTLVIPPSNRRTSYGYDPWGRPTRVVLPEVDGTATELRYRYGAGDVLERTEIVGVPSPGVPPATLFASDIEYDEMRRPLRTTRGGRHVSMWWNCDGQLDAQENFAGHRLSYVYDAARRLTSIVDPAGNEIRYAYDAANQLVGVERRELQPGGAVKISFTTMRYDARGNLAGYTDPMGNEVVQRYDDRGLQTEIIDPLGHSTRMRYALGGELIERSTDVDGTAVLLQWLHDAGGRMYEYVDPEGASTRFMRNAFDDLVTQVFPDGSAHQWSYTEDGDLARETTPGGSEVQYSYDDRGDLARVQFTPASGVSATPDIVYERDGMGRITRVSHGDSTVDREYDDTSRLTAEVIDGLRSEMAYDDAAGERHLTYPDGRTDRIVFDALNRPVQIVLQSGGTEGLPPAIAAGDTIASFTYAGFQSPVSRLTAGGIQTTWGYDGSGRLISLRHARVSDDVPLASLQYVYDALGRRRVQSAGPVPLRPSWNLYDSLSRLRHQVEGVSLPDLALPMSQAEMDAVVGALGTDPDGDVARTYSLDRADVRQEFAEQDTSGMLTTTYATNALRQITAATTTDPVGAVETEAYGFNADSARIDDNRHRFVFDALGRLVEVREKATGVVLLTQQFDGLNRVARRTTAEAGAERLVHFGDRLVQMDDGAGAAVVQRVVGLFDDDVVLETRESNQWSLLDDRLSRLALCSDGATILERYHYEPFGQSSVWSPDGTSLVAPGDQAGIPIFSGLPLVLPNLYMARARAYDPDTGMFLQRDAEGYVSGPCLYLYAGHNPIDFRDASGQWIESAWDIASLGLGLYSAYDDFQTGSWGWFALDVVGVLLDTAALILPLVPGGVGAAIKLFRAGNAAVDMTGAGVRTGRIVVGESPELVRAGQYAYRAETIVRGGQAIDSTINVGQGFYQAGVDFSDDDYAGGMLNLGMAGLGARGVMANRYDMPSPGRLPLNFRERPFYTGGRYPLYGSMPWRARGNTVALLTRPRVQYGVGNLLLDDRPFRNVSRQYWRLNPGGRSNGMQLQHLWVMNSTTRVPRGIRNSGLNLVEVPGRLNSWMGDNPIRNGAFRLQVLSYAAATGTASYQTTEEIMDLLTGAPHMEGQMK